MGAGLGEVTKMREAADSEGSGTQGRGEAETLTAKGRGRQRLLSSRQDCMWKGHEKPRRGLVTGTP